MPPGVIAVLMPICLRPGRGVFPRRAKKERPFLARRVGRYFGTGPGLDVSAVAAIDDVRRFAPTLELASADVATARFGGCVLRPGGTFTGGDRLEIDGAPGDVRDIQLLRTTLVEVHNGIGVGQLTGWVFIVSNNLGLTSRGQWLVRPARHVGRRPRDRDGGNAGGEWAGPAAKRARSGNARGFCRSAAGCRRAGAAVGGRGCG